MRLLIDEDTAVQLVEPLRHVLLGHEVAHISDLSWKGKKDLRVLPGARSAGFHVLITRDRAQFNDPRECDAIKKSELHHVHYAQREGARGLALALGAIIATSRCLAKLRCKRSSKKPGPSSRVKAELSVTGADRGLHGAGPGRDRR